MEQRASIHTVEEIAAPKLSKLRPCRFALDFANTVLACVALYSQRNGSLAGLPVVHQFSVRSIETWSGSFWRWIQRFVSS